MIQGFVDTHFHSFQMAEKGLDPTQEIELAIENGMAFGIEVGVHPTELGQRLKLYNTTSHLLRSTGIAPSCAESYTGDDMALLESQLVSRSNEHIVAVGEIGLDGYWNYGTPEGQQDLFRQQLQLARKHSLPVIIHNRDSDRETVAALRSDLGKSGGVMHCFSTNRSSLEQFLDLGTYISFAGNVTFAKTEELRECARYVPNDRILVETDAPYLSPVPLRGKINRPSSILHTYELIAALRGIDVQSFADLVRKNATELFGITDQE